MKIAVLVKDLVSHIGSKTEAASALGCTRATLNRWLEAGAIIVDSKVYFPTGHEICN